MTKQEFDQTMEWAGDMLLELIYAGTRVFLTAIIVFGHVAIALASFALTSVAAEQERHNNPPTAPTAMIDTTPFVVPSGAAPAK